MRILGIDYGSKRIGLAISDENGQFAMPLEVIDTKNDPISRIQEICSANQVKEIVIGESKDDKGQPNKVQSAIDEFKKQLEQVGFKVYLEPEFMTSMQVERLQGKSDKIDSSAAAIILQTFLDRRINSEKNKKS